MINISKLYCGLASDSDSLRYGHGQCSGSGAARVKRPIVVWSVTRRCNLRCAHCYTDSDEQTADGELTTQECQAVIDDLAAFQVPAVLLSGGEPTTRRDLFELARYAADKGLRLTLSTNGTMITKCIAATIKRVGFTYVGVSLDGIGAVNDRFRGVEGAFERAVAGIRHCKAVGQRVGLRMTLTDHNIDQLPGIFDFVEAEGIDRICFYHLVYAGRGRKIRARDLSLTKTRQAVEYICNRTKQIVQSGKAVEVLTVDNHADGPFVLLKLRREGSPLACAAKELLRRSGGALSSSGVGIGNIDFVGNVHPDQFWMHHTLGNVRQRPFSEIWQDKTEPLLAGLRNRAEKIHGRCRSCRFWDMCGGSLRVRADLALGDPWAPDPACYLTDEEVNR
jgi:radical SAM protein with 4Fe4S-binding SPASM domain